MADELRHQRRPADRVKPGESTRERKTGAFLEKAAEGRAWKGAHTKSRVQKPKQTAGSAAKSITLGKGVVRGRKIANPGGPGSGVTKIAETIEQAFAAARVDRKPVHIGFTIEPSGVVKIAKSTVNLAARSGAKEAGIVSDLEAALGRARERGAARIAEIIGGPEMMSADEFGRMIGATRETVNRKRHRHEVLGLEGPTRGVRFPAWQLTDDGGLLPGLPALFDEIGDRPWAVYRFLVAAHPELGETTGAEAMKQGRVAEALALAASVGRGTAT
jgi:hypothetical protein